MSHIRSAKFAFFDLAETGEQLFRNLELGAGVDYCVFRLPRRHESKWFVWSAEESKQELLRLEAELKAKTERERLRRLKLAIKKVLSQAEEATILISGEEPPSPRHLDLSRYAVNVQDSQPLAVWIPVFSTKIADATKEVYSGSSDELRTAIDKAIAGADSSGTSSAKTTPAEAATHPSPVASALPPTIPPTDKHTAFQPDPSGSVYPCIKPEKDHVVQNQRVKVAVVLSKTPCDETSGEVGVPREKGVVHEFQVLLRLGCEVQQDTLQYTHEAGTTKKAEFSVTAPKYKYAEDRRDFRPIHVNFYLKKRWCGEGIRNIEILPDEETNPATGLPEPALPLWSGVLNVAAGPPAPDLLVRIEKDDTSGALLWSYFSPHEPKLSLDFSSLEKLHAPLKGGPEGFVRSKFEKLTKSTLDRISMASIQGVCERIYEAAPDTFRQVYWALYDASHAQDSAITFDTIQFVTDEPFIPWEFMRVADSDHVPPVPGELLAKRHAVGRWLASQSSFLRNRIDVQEMKVFASSYQNVAAVLTKLPWADQEGNYLATTYLAKPKATRGTLSTTDVLDFLEHGHAQAIHFSCHGKMNQAQPSESLLLLEDDQEHFNPDVVQRQQVRDGIGKEHPFVFLNACQVGGAGENLTLVTGFPQAFVGMGATAVVAPLWSINDECAAKVSQKFYQLVLGEESVTLGQALQRLRQEFETEKNLTYIAYVLYGDPTARIYPS